MIKSYPSLRINLFFLLAFVIATQSAYSGKELEVSKDFTLFTSKNLQGYLKPLFTSIGESFNTNYYTTANYKHQWSIGLDISINGLLIPDEHKLYDAELPEAYGTSIVDNAMLKEGNLSRNFGGTIKQPTIFGGNSFGVFSAPQVPKKASLTDAFGRPIPDSSFKSIAFAEGKNVDFFASAPNVALIAGFPTHTQLRLKFWMVPDVQDEALIFFGFNINQQLDHFFNLFGEDSTLALALNFGYNSLSRSEGLDISTFGAGLHFSKTWDMGFTALLGVQFEGLSGKFEAVREIPDSSAYQRDVANSPYLEVREGRPISFDIESFNSFRVLGGISYKTGMLELHADAAWAVQPILSVGLTLWFAEWGQKARDPEKIEKYEEIEKIERIKRQD